MKVSINWLKEYVKIAVPVKELANRITMAGLEVEGIEIIGGSWDHVVIGKILEVNPHPNADRLRLTTVDMGVEKQTVVCGAPNLNVGDKVVFASVGAELSDPHSGQKETLKPAKIRGVLSSGMVCSESELGISDDHAGIMVLPADAPVGMPLSEYLGDTIFDMEITPNRADCLSIIGIAREVAALTGQSVQLPQTEYGETTSSIAGQVSVEISAPDLCPRYCASLIRGLKIAPSPQWMQKRLTASGMRPINNLVDVTNYVMLEYGQPLHAFDYDKVRDKKIIVRRAHSGEVIISLDGAERKLSADMLVIADTQRAVAIAGVMGGANSEVTEATQSILLESANFNPASIHRTGNALGLPSEARYRFERGIRPELALPALRRATHLLVQLGGGEVAQGVVDTYPGKQERKPILLSEEKMKRVLGIGFSVSEIKGILNSLSFECQEASPGEMKVTAPYWRNDINLEVDLIEEVARIAGYDKIPSTLLSQALPRQNPSPMIALKQKSGIFLTGCGFQEILNHTLTNIEWMKRLSPDGKSSDNLLKMSNPMSAEQEYMRPTLRAGLLTALATNRRFEEGGIRLFELSRIYVSRGNDLPDEREIICGIISGLASEKFWQGKDESVDFFYVKGIVEGLLNYIGVGADFRVGEDVSLHPGKQSAIVVGGDSIGIFGEVHPRVSRAFDIEETVYLFDIDLKALLPHTLAPRRYKPIPKFPVVVRDVALIVYDGVTHGRIQEIISSFPLVEQVNLFDVYSGKQVESGKKSLAYRIVFRSPDHTLTDKEADEIRQNILVRLSKEVGAVLRG